MRARRLLHEDVVQELRQRLQTEWAPGDRLPSQGALAGELGVSLLTLREALNLLSREGLLDVQHGRGTFVAEQQKAATIGVVVEMDISQPRASYYHLRLIQEVRRRLETNGCFTRLYIGHTKLGEMHPRGPNCRPTSREFWDDVRAGRVDGVVSISTVPSIDWLDELKSLHIPVVGDYVGFGCWAQPDFDQLMGLGVERLRQAGCRRLAYIGMFGERFRSLLRSWDLPVNEAWIREPERSSDIGAGWEAWREIWLLGDERPDALLVSDDLLFQDAAQAVVQLGIRVPDQLEVVSLVNRGGPEMRMFPYHSLEIDPDEVAAELVKRIQLLVAGRMLSSPGAFIPAVWRSAASSTPEVLVSGGASNDE